MTAAADMHGKRCVVTGATSGIGQATAIALARAGADLTLVCRSRARGEATRERVRAEAPGSAVDLVIADLSSQAEVRRAAAQILADDRPIHVLINNAGVVRRHRTTTVDGIETTFAVNHLAYFLLTGLLLERLRTTPGARIVNVASDAHRISHMDFAELDRTGRDEGGRAGPDDRAHGKRFRWMRVYGQSKLANILFTRELARRLAGSGVTVNALHPGGVATGLGATDSPALHRLVMTLGRPFLRSPEAGAQTSIYLATSPEVAGTSGEYFSNCKRVPGSRESRDPEVARRLWEVSERLTGLAAGSAASGDAP